mmetsp:Transcript_98631/g.279077  ORF Transcript_98631/g.279077 Transcript_98631/m.279077 type:complete len:232 (+) Transcript_98631:30-725(+)
MAAEASGRGHRRIFGCPLWLFGGKRRRRARAVRRSGRLLPLTLRGAAVHCHGRRRNHVSGRAHVCDAALRRRAEHDAVLPQHREMVQKLLGNLAAPNADQTVLEDVRWRYPVSCDRLERLEPRLPQKLIVDVPGDKREKLSASFLRYHVVVVVDAPVQNLVEHLQSHVHNIPFDASGHHNRIRVCIVLHSFQLHLLDDTCFSLRLPCRPQKRKLVGHALSLCRMCAVASRS